METRSSARPRSTVMSRERGEENGNLSEHFSLIKFWRIETFNRGSVLCCAVLSRRNELRRRTRWREDANGGHFAKNSIFSIVFYNSVWLVRLQFNFHLETLVLYVCLCIRELVYLCVSTHICKKGMLLARCKTVCTFEAFSSVLFW